jgi:hypothetical protein
VLALRYYEGLCDIEIADLIGCKPGTVRGYASRALAALRVEMNVRPGQAPEFSKAKAKAIAAPASTLRTRLLAAIDTTSGDILYAHGSQAADGGTWQWPAYPQPGQGVHLRVLGLDSNGAVFEDGEYSFPMPPGNDATSDLDQGGLQLSGSLMAVNHRSTSPRTAKPRRM